MLSVVKYPSEMGLIINFYMAITMCFNSPRKYSSEYSDHDEVNPALPEDLPSPSDCFQIFCCPLKSKLIEYISLEVLNSGLVA